MAVYLEVRPDPDILAEIGDVRHILVVGCPGCANTNYSLCKDLPVAKVTATGIKALGTKAEIVRITSLFAERGISVDPWLSDLYGTICMLGKPARKKLFNRAQTTDAVVTLCCESGRDNVQDIVGKQKVVGAMSAKGLLCAVTERRVATLFIDSKTQRIRKFFLDGNE